MPLLAILDEGAHGALDDSLKTLYKQNSETKQFYLDISPDEAGKVAFNLQAEKTKLAENNAELLKQKGEANSKLKVYESLGKTAEEIKQALEANRPEETAKLVTDYEARIKSLQDSFDESLKKESSAKESYQKQLHESAVDTEIARLSQSLAFDLNDTAPFVLRNYLKPEEVEDGKVVVRVFENGNPALVAGQPKTPEQLLQGFREDKKYLSIFKAGDNGGPGGNNRQTNVPPGTKTMKRSEYDRRILTDPEAVQKQLSEGYKVVDD